MQVENTRDASLPEIKLGSSGSFADRCRAHSQSLSKRKRQQDEQMEQLLDVTVGQLEMVINSLVTTVQHRHSTCLDRFEQSSQRLHDGLETYMRVEKKLKSITAILLGSAAD
ncbi:hypothetical protein PINS_up006180 [Pythium insidiosum]|nr:hypothetical protein PINS_up006180 [Pythium insidiosum]